MIVRPDDGFPKAREAALKALELDSALAEAHASLAEVKWAYDWDLTGAEQGLKGAIALNPGYASARHWYAGILTATGRFDEAIAEIRRAQQLDPLSIQINTATAGFLYRARRYDEAIEECRKTLDFAPESVLARLAIGWLHTQKGSFEPGIAEMKRAVVLSDNDPFHVACLGCAYAMAGMAEEAGRMLEAVEHSSQRRYSLARKVYDALVLRPTKPSDLGLEPWQYEPPGAPVTEDREGQ